ncbi:unnamed protein product [marine sediment metagenome]|uniref:Uncharacterized protein n=1 Tax=marine sediment metagenome TaxID=412755 RepID=X1HGV1_9ZZZZ
MSDTIPDGFSIKSKSSFLKLSYLTKDLASKKQIMEVVVTRGMRIPFTLVLYNLEEEELLREYKTGIFSPRYIIKKGNDEKAEFWLKSKNTNNFYEISYGGRIIRSHTKKNIVFKFKDFQEKEYFRLDFDWGGKDEYLVEVQDNIDSLLQF